MHFVNQSFPTPAENLACDEALLNLSESGADYEILRLWQPTQRFVVLGYSNAVASEINAAACLRKKIPVLRRCSGGGTVLQSPGCLNFSLILRITPGPTESIRSTTCWVLERHRSLFEALVRKPVSIEGISDLAIAKHKFAGHAQRRKKRFVLFHGSILLNADLSLMEPTLRLPSHRPAYRKARSHSAFVVNLKLPAGIVSDALQQTWGATKALDRLPYGQIEDLARTRYTTDMWNYRF